MSRRRRYGGSMIVSSPLLVEIAEGVLEQLIIPVIDALVTEERRATAADPRKAHQEFERVRAISDPDAAAQAQQEYLRQYGAEKWAQQMQSAVNRSLREGGE